jgi:multidrug efflux pump subunit AcrB
MPTDTNKGLHRTWGGLRSSVRPGGDQSSVTVTFDYGGNLRTIVSRSVRAAVAEAEARWGNDYANDPVVSSPESIFNDLTGWTKRNHGQDFHRDMHSDLRNERRRRTRPEPA